TCALFPRNILASKQLLITAGPTKEAIDPVRYISNHSSGKQGYALAEAALEAGALVTLVSGPTSLAPPDRAEIVPVTTAEEMLAAVMQRAPGVDVFIGVAAVADYRPAQSASQKLKKTGDDKLTLELQQNPDILAAVAGLKDGPYTVGFAAETENLEDHARSKLTAKKLDMIVANNVADPGIGFNADDNQATIITASETLPLARMSKQTLARELITLIAKAVVKEQP
ncbi:MAG: bifunctional phosphopantothenoylcysteine decarboxylase/phosphopantothenate--cysteine ligase CoaBC, partial [Pseudomonadales bacterium]